LEIRGLGRQAGVKASKSVEAIFRDDLRLRRLTGLWTWRSDYRFKGPCYKKMIFSSPTRGHNKGMAYDGFIENQVGEHGSRAEF
jgi:hypothetical protein